MKGRSWEIEIWDLGSEVEREIREKEIGWWDWVVDENKEWRT